MTCSHSWNLLGKTIEKKKTRIGVKKITTFDYVCGICGESKSSKKRLSQAQGQKLSKLIKEADRVFSLWIRERDGWACVICGNKEQVQNGHLIRRGKKNVRWDEHNCNCQCSRCNYKHNAEPEPYTEWFLLKWGEEIYLDLVKRSREFVDLTAEYLISIINKYK